MIAIAPSLAPIVECVSSWKGDRIWSRLRATGAAAESRAMDVQASAEHVSCSECAHRDVCRSGLACEALAAFVETGAPIGDRTPGVDHYIVLFPSVSDLRAKWRRDAVRQGLAGRRVVRSAACI